MKAELTATANLKADVSATAELTAELTAAPELTSEQKQLAHTLELAVRDYTSMIPRIKDLTNKISFRKLKKVYNAVATFPIRQNPNEFKKDSLEQELFFLTIQANMAKTIILEVYNNGQTEEIQSAVTTVTEEVSDGME